VTYVRIKRYSGNKLIELKKSKFQFMVSHMAHRPVSLSFSKDSPPPTVIKKLTGHSDLKTLMKYENTGEDALKEVLEKVGSIAENKIFISHKKNVI
jgi:hypothetical protein